MEQPNFLIDATLLDTLPRPPEALRPVRRRLRPATDLLADWLCAYGDHRDVEPLPEHIFRAYFEADLPVLRRPTPGVFAALVKSAHGPQGNPGGEVV